MHLAHLRFLLSPAGQAVLAELAADPPTADTQLAVAERLRARLGPDETHAALETSLLRQRAAPKFSRADAMFFTREGLEQATAEPVAAHRARRYAAGTVVDMGCGIGSDALALAATGATVFAIDLNPVHAALARANAAVYGLGDRVRPVVADVTRLPPPAVDAFFFDPARRTAGGPRAAPSRRLRSVDDYQPPLSLLDTWRQDIPDGAAKVSPGIAYEELPAAAEVEFVSLAGEVKEAVLWFGALKTDVGRRATLLPTGDTLTDRDGDDTAALAEPRAYLYEPDGAVIRAHLVGQLAGRLGAAQIDPAIAYLTAGTPQPTPFARCFRLDDAFPFQLKRLRDYLRRRGIGQVTIKKRGSPLDPDGLRQALRLQGTGQATLFLTQVMGRHTVLIGRPHDL